VERARGRRGGIYHYRRALDGLSRTPGLSPRRLYTVMYPLHRVSVRGRERRGEDFDELEWFLIRAIAHAGLDSVPALCDFYGLDERLVELVVGALQSAGHLDRGGDGRLALTGLGRESLGDRAPHQVGEARPWQRERSLESRLGF